MLTLISSRVAPLLNTALICTPNPGPGGQEVAWQKGEELRSLECVHFGSVILRLLGNFRLSAACQMHGSHFQELLQVLGGATCTLSEELAVLAGTQLNNIYRKSGKSPPYAVKAVSVAVTEGDVGLMDGWRGEALDALLDAWCLVMDDPLMSDYDTASASAGGAVVVPVAVKNGLKEMAGHTFSQLYECLLRSTVLDALSGMEEEDEEEYSSISSNLLRSICRVGRSNFEFSLREVYR